MTLLCFWTNILLYIIKYQPIVYVYMQITSWAPLWFHDDYIIKISMCTKPNIDCIDFLKAPTFLLYKILIK